MNSMFCRSTLPGANDSYWRRNEITVVITAISTFFPMFFEGLGFLESYHPRKQLRMQLARYTKLTHHCLQQISYHSFHSNNAYILRPLLPLTRIMALNLLNLYSLIFALFDKIGIMNKDMDMMRINTNALDAALAAGVLNGTDLPSNSTDLNADATTITDSAKFIVTTVSNAVTGISSSIDSLWNGLASVSTTVLPPNCQRIEVNCTKSTMFNKSLVTSLAFLTTTILPEIFTRLNMSSTYEYYDSNSSATLNSTSYDWLDGYSSSPNDFFSTIDFDNFTDVNNISTEFTTEFSDIYEDEDEDGDLAIKQAATMTSTTTTRHPPEFVENEIADEDYYEDYEGTRRKRDVHNMFDEIESYGQQMTDAYAENETMFDRNFTEFISSTITTFMENYTITAGDLSSTTVGEMWTTFVNGIDESTWTDDDIDDDDDDGETCYEIVCKTTDIDIAEEDYTTFGYEERTTEPTASTAFTCPTLPTLPTIPTMAITMESVNASKKKYIGKKLTAFINHMDESQQMSLRKLCWETMFGQELVKLTVLDLVIYCL